MSAAWLIAVAPTQAQEYHSLFLWGFVLIAMVLVAFGAFSYFRRWIKSADEPTPIGFGLWDLRELHRQGKMSDEEFELARAKMVAAAKRMTDKMPAVLPRRTPPTTPTTPGSGPGSTGSSPPKS